MVQQINDHSTALADRDVKKKKDTTPAFQPQPDVGRVGAMASYSNPQPSAMGAEGDPNNPNGGDLGSMMSPSLLGTEPPPTNMDEQNARIQRNTAFLQNPTTKAQLLQFSLSMLAGAGRGNVFSNLGNALSEAATLPARQKAMNLKAANTLQEMDLRSRADVRDETRLQLEQKKLEFDILKNGGMKFSRVISGDDPLNERFGLGLKPGERARTEFVLDANGKIVNASVEAPFGSTATGESTIPELYKQAEQLDAEGKHQEANLVRSQAQAKATGPGGYTAKGQLLQQDTNSPTGSKLVNIPGGEADIAAQKQAKADEEQSIYNQQRAHIVLDSIDRATNTIKDSIAPNVFVTGWGDFLKYVPGSEAADFSETIATIKANNTVRALSELRKGSNSGASGLGQVTEFEDKMLASITGSLEQKQTAGQMLHNLQTVKQVYDAIVNTGSLSDIGHKVDDGTWTEAQGLAKAAEVLQPKGEETQSSQEKDQEAVPFPEKTDSLGLTPDQLTRVQAIWPSWTNEQRRAFLNGDPVPTGGQ